MKVSELKTIVDALARFATIREKVDGPTGRIGVQAGAGRLKLISSDGTSGTVVDVQASADRLAYYIDARPLFQGVKALPAKSEIELSVDSKGLTVTAAAGGSLLVPNKGSLGIAGFAKKPKDDAPISFTMDEERLHQVAKLFPCTIRGEETLSSIKASLHIEEDAIYWTFVEPRVNTKYASLKIPMANSMAKRVAIMDSAFVEALRATTGSSEVHVGRSSVVVRSDNTEMYTSTQGMEHWPVLAVQGSLNSFNIDRKRFIDILKGQVPNDEHARVVMTWEKDSLEIRPYGGEGGQTIPVTTIGHGMRAASATLLIDMLNGMEDAKMVTLGIAEGSPAIILRAEEYEQWTLLVAPVLL